MKRETFVPSDLNADIARDRDAVDIRLRDLVALLASQHEGIRDAILYSLLGGGKRLRPMLCLWSFDALTRGNGRRVALDVGCAVECVHTYSLIHDDLPCMDDDDLRRGRASSHKRFGEAIAILTGDALLTLAFEIIATLGNRHEDAPAEVVVEATRVLAHSAGTAGLIAGQAMDMAAEHASEGGRELVDRIHVNKTARLIATSMELGAIVAQAGAREREQFSTAGLDAGRAFQIADDLLDTQSDEETLGKTPGKDLKNKKLTYPSVAGIDAARSRAAELIAKAREGVADAGGDNRLCWLLDRLINRVA